MFGYSTFQMQFFSKAISIVVVWQTRDPKFHVLVYILNGNVFLFLVSSKCDWSPEAHVNATFASRHSGLTRTDSRAAYETAKIPRNKKDKIYF